MELIERDGTARYLFDDERADATPEALKAAYTPLKAFRTRSGLAFEIFSAEGICERCGRTMAGWPLQRPDTCSPPGWDACLRNPSYSIEYMVARAEG
jgi:hypothetical protein